MGLGFGCRDVLASPEPSLLHDSTGHLGVSRQSAYSNRHLRGRVGQGGVSSSAMDRRGAPDASYMWNLVSHSMRADPVALPSPPGWWRRYFCAWPHRLGPDGVPICASLTPEKGNIHASVLGCGMRVEPAAANE
jgi:hypothetical protein